MGLFIVILIATAFGGAVIAHRIAKRRKAERIFREVADKFGLHYSGPSALFPGTVNGKLNDHQVTIEVVADVGAGVPMRRRARYELQTRIVINSGGRIPPSLALSASNIFHRGLQELIGIDGARIKTGAAELDSSVTIRGDERRMLAALNSKARVLALDAVRDLEAFVENGTVYLVTPGIPTSAASLLVTLRTLVAFADRLSFEQAQLDERLMENFSAERNPLIRSKLMEQLLRPPTRKVITEEALQYAITHPDPSLRLRAAKVLGNQRACLSEIVADPMCPVPLRIEALEHLSLTTTSSEDLFAIARALLKEGAVGSLVELQVLAIEILAKGNDRDALPHIIAKLTSADPELTAAIAQALGKFDDSVEHQLIWLLALDDLGVRLAAAESLARVGTIRAVEPLLEVSKGLFVASELKEQARAAIVAIQSRLAGAEGGGLSIVGGDDEGSRQGALSLEHEQGALSVDDQSEAPSTLVTIDRS